LKTDVSVRTDHSVLFAYLTILAVAIQSGCMAPTIGALKKSESLSTKLSPNARVSLGTQRLPVSGHGTGAEAAPRSSQKNNLFSSNDFGLRSTVTDVGPNTTLNSFAAPVLNNDQEAGDNHAQNDWDEGNSAVAKTGPATAAEAVESSAKLETRPNYTDDVSGDAPAASVAFVTPVSSAPEEYRSVKRIARPENCILVSASLCAAVRDRRILALTAAQTAMSISDGETTIEFVKHGFVEVDPISRILIGRKPNWGRMAPVGAIQIVASVWLAGRMKTRSHTWIKRIWWMPQVIQIGASAFGTVNNLKLYR
jgi:hypothetical protein